MTFKKLAVGFAIFALTVLLMVFAQRAFFPEPENNCGGYYRLMMEDGAVPASGKIQSVPPNYYNNSVCQEQYQNSVKDQERNSFILILAMSVLAIVGGVLVKSVPTISWGLISAGLVMTIYVLFANYESVGKPWLAAITGIALAVLIFLAHGNLAEDAPVKNSAGSGSDRI